MEQAPTCSLPLLAAIGAPVKGDSDDPSPAGRAVPSAAPRRGLVKCKGGSGGGCFGDGDSRSGGSRGWGKTEALGTGSHWDTGAFVFVQPLHLCKDVGNRIQVAALPGQGWAFPAP